MQTNIFNHSEIYNIRESVSYAEGSVVSKIIQKDKAGNITLFAFDRGQVLSEHTAPFDAMVQVLDGEVKITIDKKGYQLKEGDFIIMPANIPHALSAQTRFKMLLIMLKA